MKKKNIAVFTVIIILLIVAVLSLSKDIMSPYVSFDHAMKHNDTYVQVIGALDKKVPVSYNDTSYAFTIQDEKNTRMKVTHGGSMPLNFDHAERIVLLGKYSRDKELFEADKVLVKCPSKYTKEK